VFQCFAHELNIGGVVLRKEDVLGVSGLVEHTPFTLN
jgi:hypothetical protein